MLDLDALPPPTTDTAKTWVWHGSRLLDEGPGSTWDRAIIKLSPGGSDADTAREMDLAEERFLSPEEGGFALPRAAKTQIAYRSRDEVLVGTDFDGSGESLTDSGYPRVVKSWRRGTPIEDAVVVFEAEQADIAGGQWAYHDRGHVHEFQRRSVTFYTSKHWYRALTGERLKAVSAADEETPFAPVPVPDDAEISTFAGEALLTLRSDWKPEGGASEGFKAGALLTLPMADVMKEDWSKVLVLFEPTPSKSLQSTTTTRDYVVLSVLEDVRKTLVVWKKNSAVEGPSFLHLPAPDGVQAVGVGEDVAVSNVNRDDSMDNRLFLWRDGFLVPDTLELVPDVANLVAAPAEAGAEGAAAAASSAAAAKNILLKSKPSMFDASGLVVEQHFATSKDGTKIPYFVMKPEGIVADGTNPTLLDAYGGFEISMLPYYSAGVGAGWLEKGGVKVIANIRGGGEYGPTWHQAALKEKRYKCYEDVEAVAADLIERLKITSPPKLACIGGSNGGLLVGNLITRPVASKLFGAAVCQVPLLDMKVFSHLLAGASWMAEYGDPDKPEEWAFLRRHSAYHLLRHDNLGMPEEPAAAGGGELGEGSEGTEGDPSWVCPKVLFTTSTRDDRVHPAHARKMVSALLEEARPRGLAPVVHYWENIEGGHGGAADNKQRAHMWALTYTFLCSTLGLASPSP